MFLCIIFIDAEMDRTEITGVEAFSSERQYDCVICGQTSSSTIDRPFGEAVLLQATSGISNSSFFVRLCFFRDWFSIVPLHS